MEKSTRYIVKITPEAERFYIELLSYLFQTHSSESANRKSKEILNLALSLSLNPNRGRMEESLAYLNKAHQFLVFQVTSRKTVKLIYFVDEDNNTVYVTDFFPTELNPIKLKRNR